MERLYRGFWKMRQAVEGELSVAISQELLDILACPKCKGELHLTEKHDGLVCEACKLRYPIKDDIPIMLVEEAETIA
jgi:uncharacterized protein YbaR (Trm112 family)